MQVEDTGGKPWYAVLRYGVGTEKIVWLVDEDAKMEGRAHSEQNADAENNQ